VCIFFDGTRGPALANGISRMSHSTPEYTVSSGSREIVVPVSSSSPLVEFSEKSVTAELLQKIDTFCLHDGGDADLE
jgi:hypothetical protein